jgi:hypothetical protein
MRSIKALRTAEETNRPLVAKRRKDRLILFAFNFGLVAFFIAIYFLSLLGFAL